MLIYRRSAVYSGTKRSFKLNETEDALLALNEDMYDDDDHNDDDDDESRATNHTSRSVARAPRTGDLRCGTKSYCFCLNSPS